MLHGETKSSRGYLCSPRESHADRFRVLGEGDDPRSYAELHGLVGISDSGQFNSRLDKLVDSFVRRTDSGEYELSFAGGRGVGAIFSEEFDRNVSLDRFPLADSSVDRGVTMEAEYEDDVVTIQCPKCDQGNCRFCFPPGGTVDGFRERLTKVLDRWLQNRYPSNADGIWDNGTAAIES